MASSSTSRAPLLQGRSLYLPQCCNWCSDHPVGRSPDFRPRRLGAESYRIRKEARWRGWGGSGSLAPQFVPKASTIHTRRTLSTFSLYRSCPRANRASPRPVWLAGLGVSHSARPCYSRALLGDRSLAGLTLRRAAFAPSEELGEARGDSRPHLGQEVGGASRRRNRRPSTPARLPQVFACWPRCSMLMIPRPGLFVKGPTSASSCSVARTSPAR